MKADNNYVSHLGFFPVVFHQNGRKRCIIVVTSLHRAKAPVFSCTVDVLIVHMTGALGDK